MQRWMHTNICVCAPRTHAVQCAGVHVHVPLVCMYEDILLKLCCWHWQDTRTEKKHKQSFSVLLLALAIWQRAEEDSVL
jgi:hypothetical protein